MSTRDASMPKRQRSLPGGGAFSVVPPSPEPSPEPSLWAISDVAQFLKVTVKAVRCMLQRRIFPESCLLKIGARVRFRPELVRAWVLAQKPGGYSGGGRTGGV
jgi:Helix-turn-helix domain